MRGARSVVLLALAFVVAAMPARGAPVEEFDTSIRAAGMGGATTAVGWGEPGVWGNPASLATFRGIAWLEGTTRLAPEYDPPIRLKSRRFLLGGPGIGVSLMGEPVDALGHTRLEYELNGGTDPYGNPIGSVKLTDETNAFGVALSPMQLVDAIRARTSPDAPSLARYVDVSVGYQHKSTKLSFVPGVTADGENHDWGVLARVGLVPGDAASRSTRVELSVGHAELNADQRAHFVAPNYGDLGGSTLLTRTGVAVRVLLPFGELGDSDARPWAWPSSVASAVGLGVAFDRERRSNFSFFGYTDEISHWGFEATFMDVLAARVGYVEDESNDIHDMTGGLGVHAPIGPWATAGYDWASAPSVAGMKNMNRHGVSVWLHPDAIWRSWRGAK